MEEYYHVLGVSGMTSKVLLKIAYITAIDFSKKNQIDKLKIAEIHIAYQILRRFSYRLRYLTTTDKEGKVDKKLQRIIDETRERAENERIIVPSLSRRFRLEIKYIIRSLLFGIFSILFSIFSDAFSDYVGFVMDFRRLFASLFFFFAVINFWGDWINSIYSFALIVISIGLVVWQIKEFEKKVIKAVSNYKLK